ncbi:hypothetical protein GZH47_14575 [Paenibacillus rhizovicinus]|uniref:Uncharacterized protein n=1 Tax=Paenibacillus rhizovicinus TaxID=2704463 RepID=A0A6C0P0L5_9BACL|nr:hypothetical protein [Paenibacillus rhizovicinus]QHW31921.1 hypothetical protein GZH47_14575 [Paenibacillus rhizovicinus]
MTDQNDWDESLREIIFECKQLIQQLDQQLEGISILFTEKSNACMDELYNREQLELILDGTDCTTMELHKVQNGELTDGNPDAPKE